MKTTSKILIGLFVIIYLACNNTAANSGISSISFVNGHVILDTDIILTNKNLYSFIDNLYNEDLVQKNIS